MKSIYEVSYSDYGVHESYGTLEDFNVANRLCEQVNQYFKENNIEKEATVNSWIINVETDKIYLYRAYLSFKDKDNIIVESITPTYNIIQYNEFINDLEDGIKRGYPSHGMVRFGTTKEEAIEKIKLVYKKVEEANLIQPLLELIAQKERDNNHY